MNRRSIPPYFALVLLLTTLLICLSPIPSRAGVASRAPSLEPGALRLDNLLEPDTVIIPAGPYLSGSDQRERETAYILDEEAYQHHMTRRQRWYERERELGTIRTDAFAITRTPITNGQYSMFITATGHRPPDVDEPTWTGYGLVHPFARTRRHAWRDARPPPGRENHPVVLVSYADAVAYAQWLSHTTGQRWQLPTESQWEKAMRGTDGRLFPWGNDFDPKRLNSHDAGPFDTIPVATYPTGASPFGVLDGAGQVFEWIRKPGLSERAWVKGGSWDDKGCGACRPAARHTRPIGIKHILIGFRLVRE